MAGRFWVGGTGTWDGSSTTHWSASSGGANGASVPVSGDDVTFDASSGGGTVTVNATIPATGNLNAFTMGAFTGTLDFSANNNNFSASQVNITGTGVRTLNMGNGTWAITGGFSSTVWDAGTTTNLTFNANSSTLAFSATGANQGRTFTTGSLTYNNVTIAESSVGRNFVIAGAGPTIGTLTITAPLNVCPDTNRTLNLGSGGLVVLSSSATAPLGINLQTGGAVWTISKTSGTQTWDFVFVQNITCSGGATFTATNSFKSGTVTGITVSPPGGGGAFISG